MGMIDFCVTYDIDDACAVSSRFFLPFSEVTHIFVFYLAASRSSTDQIVYILLDYRKE